MEKKEIFVTPTLDVTTFAVEDIVTASNTGGGVVLPEDEW